VTPPTRRSSFPPTVPAQSAKERSGYSPSDKPGDALQRVSGRMTAANPGLEIRLARGTASGPTRLAAFDAALREVGAANYNLIRLSSVIPSGSVVRVSPVPLSPPGEWGDRLYVVTAEAYADVPGIQAWAGIGWIQDPELGRGLLVEHESPSHAEVRADVEASLASLRRGRGRLGDQLGEVQMVTAGVSCTDQPVCALVIAVFAVEPWPVGSRPGLSGGLPKKCR